MIKWIVNKSQGSEVDHEMMCAGYRHTTQNVRNHLEVIFHGAELDLKL